MDLQQSLGRGIVSGGAALVWCLVALIFRWLWLGMKVDLANWRERRAARRAAGSQAARVRVEPPLH